MHWIRYEVVGTLESIFRAVTKALIAYIGVLLAAMGCSTVEHLERFPLLGTVAETGRVLREPVEAALKLAVPTVFDGFDATPYLLLGTLFLALAAVEFYLNRLSDMSYSLRSDKKRRAAEKAAAAEARARASAVERAVEEASAKAERSAQQQKLREEQYRRQLEAVEQARLLAAEKAREEARLQLERDLRAEAEREALAEGARASAASAHLNSVPHPQEGPAPAGGGPNPSREELLEILAKAKKSLDQQKQDLSFLAIDVVDSTGMKIGEEPAIVERDFRQYKKLVEKAIADNHGLKAAWTPDGVMICFGSVQSAVSAAQQVIRSLEGFNAEVKAIRTPFKVRCGINAGSVLFDDTVPMQEMSDRTIDIAGHMQKYAKANTIYIGKQAIEGMRVAAGFRPAHTSVDGCEVYEWGPEAPADPSRN